MKMDLMKMKEIKYLVLICSMSLFFLGCQERKQFSTDKWFAKKDIFYTDRKFVIEDLLDNHLIKGKCIEEIKSMLGEPVELARRKLDQHIFYEVETKYGSDIDPKWVRYLEIRLDSDSCFVEAELIKLK